MSQTRSDRAMKSSWWASTSRQVSSVLGIGLLLGVPEAVNHVVVHHARGLHERIAYGGADKTEACLLQRFAHGIRDRRRGRKLGPIGPFVADRGMVDERPKITVEAAVLG